MKKIKQIVNIIIVGLLVVSCNKDTPVPEVNPINSYNTAGSSTFYKSLSAEDDTIAVGTITTITAVAVGDGLTYNWSASAGNIMGSGSQVSYGAAACCIGNNIINCSVKNANGQQETKSITILVQ